MILNELKCYIESHPKCSQRELAKIFKLSEDGIDAMLAVWVKKGKIKTIVLQRDGRTERRYVWLCANELGITLMQ